MEATRIRDRAGRPRRTTGGRRAAARAAVGLALAVALAALAAGCGGSGAESLDSDDADARLKAVRALADDTSEESLDALAEAAAHSDLTTAKAAVRALGRRRALGPLRRTAREAKRPAVRKEAVVQLRRIKLPETPEELRAVLKSDPDASVRAAAATGLGQLRDRESIPLLIETVESDRDKTVRVSAVGALETMASGTFGYDPTAPDDEQAAALERIRRWARGDLFGEAPPKRP
jgi:HEAT repeat protein